MRVRKDVWKLPAGDDTLAWYGKAVAAMQALPTSDPGSWTYQSAVHGIAAVPPEQSEYWAACQHGSSFFLPWHRMYLLRFERIVAATIVKLGGPAGWALPYWDYSTNSAYRALPVAFRSPKLADGSPNPLYTGERNPKANSGAESLLGAKDVDVRTCLTALGTTAPGGFFGGAASEHFGSSPGALEMTPHNVVHRQVGKGGGLMADPDRAALDPIFWLHHANIDRLWEVWLRRDPAHLNLTTAFWLTGVSFSFRDETGNGVLMKTADVLDLAAPALDYSYEDISDPLATAPRARAAGGPAGSAMTAMTTSSQLELVGATTAPVQLGSQATHVRLPTPVTPQAFKAAASPKAPAMSGPASALVQRVILQLENVTSTAIAPTYDLYIDVPDRQDPSAHEDRFVGRVAMFGIAQASNPSGRHGGGGQSFALDITDLYHRLFDAGELDPKSMRVSFVPVEPEGDPRVSVGRISLYFT
jgi:tyrosinase